MNWKKFNGFSLMEMMVVLLIVAIVLAASAPMISRKMVSGTGDGSCKWHYVDNNGSIGYNTGNGSIIPDANSNQRSAYIGTTHNSGNTAFGRPKLVIGSNSAASPHILLSGAGTGAFGSNSDSAVSIMVSQTNNGFAIRQQRNDGLEGTISRLGDRALSIGLGTAANDTGSIAFGTNALSTEECAIAIGSSIDDAVPNIPLNIPGTNLEEQEQQVSFNTYNNYTLAGLIKNTKDKFNSFIQGYKAYATDVSQTTNNVQVAPNPLNAQVTKARGIAAIAIGMNADARANGTIAIGRGSIANDPTTTAIGYLANATGNYTTAVGANTRAINTWAVSMGYSTLADGACSLAIGTRARAEGARTVAIGASSGSSITHARAIDSIAIGTHALAGGTNAEDCIAIGAQANATGDMSTAVGYKATASANNATAYGHNATASQPNSMAIGRSANADGDESIAIGYEAVAGNASANPEHTDCVAIGHQATATGDMSTAVGYASNASGANATAYGHGANASAANSMALGRGAQAEAGGAIAIGMKFSDGYRGTTAKGAGSIALGPAANAGGQAIAIGLYPEASGTRSIAIGAFSGGVSQNTTAGAESSIAIGTHAVAKENYSIAIGLGATASGVNSVAIGHDATADEDNEIVLGTSDSTVYIPGRLIVGDGTLHTYPFIRAQGPSATVDIYGHKLTVDSDISLEGGDISISGNFYGSNIPSDRRLKNVGDVYKAGIAELKKLEFFHYTFKDDKNKTPRVGVIAQDLQKIFPDAVIKGEDGFLRIRLEDMFYAAINAIKELDTRLTELSVQVKSNMDLTAKLQAKIDAQQKEIAELKKANADFEKRLSKLEKTVK